MTNTLEMLVMLKAATIRYFFTADCTAEEKEALIEFEKQIDEQIAKAEG